MNELLITCYNDVLTMRYNDMLTSSVLLTMCERFVDDLCLQCGYPHQAPFLNTATPKRQRTDKDRRGGANRNFFRDKYKVGTGWGTKAGIKPRCDPPKASGPRA